MNALEKQDALKRCAVLAHASEDAMQPLADAAHTEAIEPGEVVFESGDVSSRVYVVVSGSLRAWVGDKLVSVFEPGALFGEYAMFANGVRVARVVASEPAVLLSIDELPFREFLLNCPEATLQLLETAVRRLSRAERTPG